MDATRMDPDAPQEGAASDTRTSPSHPSDQSVPAYSMHRPRWTWGRVPRGSDAGFALAVSLLVVVSVLLLTLVGGTLDPHTIGSRPVVRTPAPTGASAGAAQTSGPMSGPMSARTVVHHSPVQVYALPEQQAGLMQPAEDARGDLWVGAMGTNRLLRLDARTGAVDAWEPPNGRNGSMQTVIDAAGRVWFTEQNANYVGRFNPATQTFATYPLGTVNSHGMAPQDLQFDAAGRLWFTEVSGGRIGRLDLASGAIDAWPVPPPAPGVASYPFSLAVTSAGQVWFGYLGGGSVGHLDPSTGRVTLTHLSDPHAQVFSMAADAHGHVWFTELERGRSGLIDAATGRVTELEVSTALGTPSGLYEVVVARDGDVWFPVTSANVLVRYAPGTATFTFYPLPVPASVPYGLALDASTDAVWFTASVAASYVGKLSPS